MKKIINIIPATNLPPDRNQVFSYLINNEKELNIGQVVKVPFGGRVIDGIVAGYEKNNKIDRSKLKFIKAIESDEVSINKLQLKLVYWMYEHYCSSLGANIKLMLVKKVKSIKKNHTISPENKSKHYQLNDEQKKAYEAIKKHLNIDNKDNLSKHKRVFLLHGITGSGKTEIYMKCIKNVISNNKQAIVLVPEISLTPQTIKRFVARFGVENIAILHSKLSQGEKYEQWERIKNNKAKIVIGPRSAVFAPLKNPGVIIVDEEHDTSYKQYDQNPRYHTKEVAEKISEIENIPLIFGSATPSIESYYKALDNEYTLLELKNRYKKDLLLPPVHIVDMREELKKGNFSIFSEKFELKLNSVVNRNKQTLIFLNRRGSATFVMCRDCGYVEECPNCSVSLTYHEMGSNNMICHHCDYHKDVSTSCPKCSSKYIKHFGVGTQKIESELKKLSSNYKILRMDGDTMNKKRVHEKAYKEFSSGEYNILLGTQMITKGIDLSNIELVGIIACDVLFNFPDFRTNERAFQTITQVSGRTSRRENTGEVILQTYQPDNHVIKTASKHNFTAFYRNEIKQRKELDYPPFIKLIKIIFTGTDYNKIKHEAFEVTNKIKSAMNGKVQIIGPAPAFITRKRNKYIWNLIIKHSNIKICKKLVKIIPDYCKIDINPEDLL